LEYEIATPPFRRLAMKRGRKKRSPRPPYGGLAMAKKAKERIARAPEGSPRIYGYRFLIRYLSPPLLLDHPKRSKL